MATRFRRAAYFYTTVQDRPGEAYRLLSRLAALGFNLQAFTAVPTGPGHTQLTLFPDDAQRLVAEATRAGIALDGPHHALLVQGDDELGALAAVHEKLYAAQVNVFASSGVSDGKGSYGYVIYVRPDEYEAAARALGV